MIYINITSWESKVLYIQVDVRLRNFLPLLFFEVQDATRMKIQWKSLFIKSQVFSITESSFTLIETTNICVFDHWFQRILFCYRRMWIKFISQFITFLQILYHQILDKSNSDDACFHQQIECCLPQLLLTGPEKKITVQGAPKKGELLVVI